MGEEYDYVKVPTALLKQAIACFQFDARNGYEQNRTAYADRRHGTGRALADFTERDWTDYPEVIDAFPESLFEEP